MIEFIKFADFYNRMSFHRHPGSISPNDADRDLADSMQPYYVTYDPHNTYSCPNTFYITKVNKERIWEYWGCDESGDDHYELSAEEKETYIGVIKVIQRACGEWAISFIETRGDHRHQGIAKELIEHLMKFLYKNNIRRIYRSHPSPDGEKYTSDYISNKLNEIGCEYDWY